VAKVKIGPLVERKEKTLASPSQARVSNTRIERNGFIGDIVSSKNGTGDLFHYVIQKAGSTDVVHWGQEESFQEALESVESFLQDHQAKDA
jgi:hypothetical protein